MNTPVHKIPDHHPGLNFIGHLNGVDVWHDPLARYTQPLLIVGEGTRWWVLAEEAEKGTLFFSPEPSSKTRRAFNDCLPLLRACLLIL